MGIGRLSLTSVLDKVNDYVNEHRWNLHQKSTLLAVSGGRDSMCMLSIFSHFGWKFEVGHVNFGLRGEESDSETKMLVDYCQTNQIVLHIHEADTINIAEQNQLSIQEAARKIRYEWFEKLISERHLQYIATAHHERDNVETFFMRLLDGAGLRGLGGIPPQNGKVIRPILNLDDENINTIMSSWDVPYLNDSSNEDDKYLRNQIRRHLLPMLKDSFPTKFSNIGDSVRHLQESQEIYNTAINKKIRTLCTAKGEEKYFPISALRSASPLRTTIYECFSGYGFNSEMIDSIIHLLSSTSGKVLYSESHRIIRDRNYLILSPRQSREVTTLTIDNPQQKINTAHFKLALESKIKTDNMVNSISEFFVCAQSLKFPLLIRSWQQGDYFYPEGLNKKKKISDFFTDYKLSTLDKEKTLLLISENKIVAILGYKMDHRFIAKQGDECIRFRFSYHD